MAEKASIEQAMAVLSALGSQLQAPQSQGTEYQQLNALFQMMNPTGIGVAAGIGRGVKPLPTAGYITHPTGIIKYSGQGVIADPTNQQVFYATQREDIDQIEGSEEWLRRIQKDWTEDKFNKWRKQLIRMGYDTLVSGGIAEKGGAALDVIEGLRQYHKYRYLNGGEALPLTPGGNKQNIREAVRESVDVVSLREEIKGWGEVPFGESLDAGTADYFADRMLQKMTELARKHPSWTMEQVEAGATTRVQKEFIKEPGVRESLDDAADEEMSTKLRDSIISVSQLGSI